MILINRVKGNKAWLASRWKDFWKKLPGATSNQQYQPRKSSWDIFLFGEVIFYQKGVTMFSNSRE